MSRHGSFMNTCYCAHIPHNHIMAAGLCKSVPAMCAGPGCNKHDAAACGPSDSSPLLAVAAGCPNSCVSSWEPPKNSSWSVLSWLIITTAGGPDTVACCPGPSPVLAMAADGSSGCGVSFWRPTWLAVCSKYPSLRFWPANCVGMLLVGQLEPRGHCAAWSSASVNDMM